MKSAITVAALLVVGAGAYWQFGGNKDANAAVPLDATSAVRKGALEITVSENGYLKAKNSVNIQPQFSRAATITWLVKEGKTVEPDEVLVEFDKTDLQTQIDDKANNLVQYRTELEATRAEYEIQKRESTASVEKAEFDLSVAKMKLELYEQGEGPNELRLKKLDAEKAHSELDRAKERFDKVPDLRAQGFLTKIQEEEERIALREREIAAENADKVLELWLRYTQPMELAARRNAVIDAERGLTNAKEKAEISLKEKEVRIGNAEGRVRSTEAQLAKLQKELGYMTIKAPRAGVVYYGDPAEPWYHEQVRIGNPIHQGNTVITLPDLKEMQVLIQVHEADIDLVKLDQPVAITLEAVKGRTFTGKVTRIGAVASQNWGNPENKTFEVELTMDPIDIELRAGTTAKAEIQVETVPDVLQVPIHAIFSESGERFAFVPRGGTFERRQVQIGKSNNHLVQVVEGLSEGERVLLYDPREAGLDADGDPENARSPSNPSNPSGAAQDTDENAAVAPGALPTAPN